MTIRYSPFSIRKVNGKIIFLLFLILLLSPSCRQQRLTTMMNDFSMTEIKFPEMRQMVMGEDSVSIDLDTVPVLLVVYRDPDSCVPCQLDHMYDYRNIIDFGKEVGGEFSPVFIFSPKKKNVDTVYITLCRTRFRHPIFLDEKGLFYAENKIFLKSRCYMCSYWTRIERWSFLEIRAINHNCGTCTRGSL